MNCDVWTILKYTGDMWIMSVNNERNLRAFKMDCYRRLLKIPWTDFVSNATVVTRVQEENEELMKDIKAL